MTTSTPVDRLFRPWLRPVGTVGAVLVSVAIYLATQVSMLLRQADFSWSSFRNYFTTDQLSYLTMVVNGRNGHFAALEPFTETGANNYPRLYYSGLGLLARVTGLRPVDAWEITGVFLQMLLVAAISLACVLVTRRIWTGLLGAFPLLIGTFASWVGGGWFTQLNSHAVLWGSFGVLFTVNGEAAALSVGGAALVLLLAVFLREGVSPRFRFVVGLVVALIIGVLANVHTYSFLTIAYITAYVVAAYALASTRRRWLLIPSIILLPVVFLVGPPVASHVSQLATLLLGLLPAVPGIIDLIVRTRGRFAIFIGVYAVAAAPQIVGTWLALRAGDPFLNYRVASTQGLGVPIIEGTLGATALVIPLVLVFIAGVHRKNPLWIGYSVGVTVAWVLVAGNDRWGANQEPYRFWIDAFTITAITIAPVILSVAFAYLGRSSVAAAADETGRERQPIASLPSPSVTSRMTRIVVVVACALVVVVAGLSAKDWYRFYKAEGAQGLMSFDSAQQRVLPQLVSDRTKGLVVSDTCIDPYGLKIVTDAPVAFFNFGMAWPSQEKQIEDVIVARSSGVLDVKAAKAGGVKWLITDSSCGTNWAEIYRSDLQKVQSVSYGSTNKDVLTLWRLSS
jgi:hypothetical protein